LTDEREAQNAQAKGAPAPEPPAAPPLPNPTPHEGEAAGSGHQPTGQKGNKTLGELWRDLETSEKITAFLSGATTVVALGSLAVAMVSCQNSVSSLQMANAIGRLTDVVSAQQDQVNGIANETVALDNEASATSDEARQTSALVNAAQDSARYANLGLQQNERNFRASERPIIDQEVDASNDKIRYGFVHDALSPGELDWNFSIKNYGRTTAANIRTIKCGSVLRRPLRCDTGMLPDVTITPGNDLWASVQFPGPIPSGVPGNLLSAVVVVVVRYTDLAGTPYEMHSCDAVAPNTSVQKCAIPKAVQVLGVDGHALDKYR
jgi:hypothetical protein